MLKADAQREGVVHGTGLAVVTGAFGYTGRRIASRLLDRGVPVRTLTARSEASDRIDVRPLDFDDEAALVRHLEGADVLYNTYWVRFVAGRVDFDLAVRNSQTLFRAAREAGVLRVVHVSITNPYDDPTLPYFNGKAMVEGALARSELSYTIVRPTVMFGHGDVFINNIAWLLRRFPVFAIPGSGRYRLQPVCVDDVADVCVAAATMHDGAIVDAAGPQVFSFEELVRTIRDAIGARCALVRTPPAMALWLAKVVGLAVRDVVLTRGELDGLMQELIVSRVHACGRVRLTDWLDENAASLGRTYASELARNYRRSASS